jgi:hypothetical protein
VRSWNRMLVNVTRTRGAISANICKVLQLFGGPSHRRQYHAETDLREIVHRAVSCIEAAHDGLHEDCDTSVGYYRKCIAQQNKLPTFM